MCVFSLMHSASGLHRASSLTALDGQITRHVAATLQRQEFIFKLVRALMMFGAPTHCLSGRKSAITRVSAPLGALQVALQVVSLHNELYVNAFECVPSCHF